MSDSSRRDFLGVLGPVALAPLLGGAQEITSSDNEVWKTSGKPARAQTAATDEVQVVMLNKVECPSWPLKSLGAAIVHGDPEASGKTTFESEDHQITGGVWKCSAGTFDLTFTWDEMALLLEGELIIEEASGRKLRVLPGDFFFVPRDAKTRWTVVKPLKKLFFSRE